MLDKIIESFEKLCMQIIIDLLLVPVTLLHLYQRPERCYIYAVRETVKAETDRYTDFISPIKLSFYISIAISIITNDLGAAGNLFAKIGGFTIAEKSIILFLMNNLTAVIFSAALVWYKKEKVNSVAFRQIFQAFTYTSAYVTTPACMVIITSMAFGGTMDAEGFIRNFSLKTQFSSEDFWYMGIMVLLLALFVVGLFKTYKSYFYILKKILPMKPAVVRLVSLLFFVMQVLYISFYM